MKRHSIPLTAGTALLALASLWIQPDQAPSASEAGAAWEAMESWLSALGAPRLR